MKLANKIMLFVLFVFFLSSCSREAMQSVEEPKQTQALLEIMVEEITPATNTLWGANDPKSDEEWRILEEAALATIAAAKKTALGGSGPQDAEWAADPAFQAMAQIMLQAAEASLAAVQAHDMDALFVAGDELYAPCEACHLQFNPAVVAQ